MSPFVTQPLSAAIRQQGLKLEVIYCVGGVISPAIANMVLDGLEGRLRAAHRSARRASGSTNPKIKDFDVTTLLHSSFVRSAVDRGLDK